VPSFRNRSLIRWPALRLGPTLIAVLVGLVVAGLVTLAVINPRPPIRAFEVPISNDRFAR
jgi:hypothetical protein